MGFLGATAFTVAGYAVSWGQVAAVGWELYRATRKPQVDNSSPTYGFGSTYNTKSQKLPIPIVYGKNKVAGNTIFEDISGEDDENIAMQVAVSEGPIQSITDIKANEVDIASDTTVKLGSRTQTADNRNEYNQNFPYTAYVSVELEAGEELSGSPTITSIVEGRLVEVWDGSSWVEQYSHNPAYCLLDLITNTRYGLGIDKSRIDLESFKSVGNYCDELVDGEKRFQLDYTIDTKRSSLDHINDILATFRAFLIYAGGEVRLRVDAPDTAVQSFNMDNIVKDSFHYWKTSKNDRYNQYTVEYTDPNNHWEQVGARASIDTKIQNDGLNEETIQLFGINRFSQAGRMAKYYMKKSLYCPTFAQWGAGIDSIQCEVGDVVTVTHELPGWTDKKFRILEIAEEENDEMRITAQEYNEAVYNDDGVVEQVKKDSSLPNPFEAPASVTNLSLVEHTDVLKDGTWVPGIKVSFDRPDYIVWNSANIYISNDNGATWDFITNTTDTEYTIKELPPDSYKVKVVSQSKKGKKEDFGTANTGSITITGKDAPPPDVNWGNCTFKEQIVLRWQPINDIDLKAYEIRTDTNFGNDDSGLIYRGDGLQATIDNPTQRTYTFYIKALDRSGNYSTNANQVSVTNPAPSAPTLTGDDITEFAYALWIAIPEVSDEDLQGYKVYITESDGSGNEIGDTEIIPVATAQKITYQADAGKSFLIKIGTYDSLTSIMNDENISSAYEATTMNTQIPDKYLDQSKLAGDLSQKIDYSSQALGENDQYDLANISCNDIEIIDTPAVDLNNPSNSINKEVKHQADKVTTNIEEISNNAGNINYNSTEITQNSDSIQSNVHSITINSDEITNNSSQITQNADEIQSNVQSINSNSNDIDTNSSQITQNADKITSTVQNLSLSDNICVLTTGYSGTTSSLEVDGLDIALNSGDKLYIVDYNTAGLNRVVVSQDVAQGATTIPINSVVVEAVSGSGIKISGEAQRSYIIQNADQIQSNVTSISNNEDGIITNSSQITQNADSIETNVSNISLNEEQMGDNSQYSLGNTACDDAELSGTNANNINRPCNAFLSQVKQTASQYTVKIQSHANGEDIISGFGLANDTDGGYSEFAVLADRFKVYGNPDDPNEDAQTVFALDTQTNSLYLLGDLIADGTITARMLKSAELITDSAQIRDAIITDAKIQSLSAGKIDAGEIVADLIISNGSLSAAGGDILINDSGIAVENGNISITSADGQTTFDGNTWTVKDSNGITRVKIGLI